MDPLQQRGENINLKSREELRRARDDNSRRARRHFWHSRLRKKATPQPQVTTNNSGNQVSQEATQPQTVIVKSAPREHHLLGIILTTIVMIAVILNGTILNQGFIAHEITESSIGDTIVTKANDSLHQYGIDESVVTHSDVNKLLKQAVGQLYNGQSIDLDLSSVDSRLSNAVDDQLSNSGVGDSVASGTVINGLESEVNSTINDSLNTPQMQAAAKTIRTAKMINTGVMVIGGVLLALNLLGALIKHYFLDQLMWLGGGGALVTGALTLLIRQGLPEMAHAAPDMSDLAVTFASDFAGYAMRVIGVGLLCFLVALLIKCAKAIRNHRMA